MALYKKYIDTTEPNKKIKFSVTFNKDTVSWATNQPKKIGYQVTVTPVTRTNAENNIVIEEFGAFTGFNDCLLEVDRPSPKRLGKAIEILNQREAQYLKHFNL